MYVLVLTQGPVNLGGLYKTTLNQKGWNAIKNGLDEVVGPSDKRGAVKLTVTHPNGNVDVYKRPRRDYSQIKAILRKDVRQ